MHPNFTNSRIYADNSQAIYLNRLDEDALRKRIRRYSKMDRRGWSTEQFSAEVSRVLTQPGTNSFVLPQASIPLSQSSPVFRARVLKSADQIREVANVMHAPHSASAGRLNKEGESLLYTAIDIRTALLEVRSEPGNLVSIAQFSAKQDLETAALGHVKLPPNLSISHRRKLSLVGDFLATLISQSDKPYGQADYSESEFITKELYDLPTEIIAGWSYPSYVNKRYSGTNFAFRPDQAEAALKLDSVLIANVGSFDDYGARVYISQRLAPTDDGLLIPYTD